MRLFFIVIVMSCGGSVALGATGAGRAASPFGETLMARVDTLRPYRLTSPPAIDGVIDEAFWKKAQSVSNFKTFAPDYDITPQEQTEVALAYDSQNIYFAFRCYDDPDKIKTSVSSRDKMMQDDFICINLDAFNDQQGLNAFYVNAYGIQGDSRFAAGNEDFSPDYVWYSAGRVDSAGYTVEVQLPLKSLRYRADEPTVMGVILERYISRRTEHSSFPRLDPARGFALLTQMQPIAYSGIEHYRLIEVLPALTATRQDLRQGGELLRDKQEAEVSLTGKLGLTSDLILDATVNPDFSQVESDAGQVDVNLRYSLFYPEKRPFFLEGKDQFNTAANAYMYDPTIYYSRTIADPFIGTKLTGKIGAQHTIAALYAVDNVLEPDRPALGRYVHVPVLRYKRALNDDSFLGGLYAARELEEGNNRVAGVDGQYRVSDASYLEGNGFLSWAKDATELPATKGHTFGFHYVYNTRNLDFDANVREMSSGFRADMGYVTRTGVTNVIGFVRPKWYPGGTAVQRVDLEASAGQTYDKPSGLWETADDIAVNIYFLGSWLFRTRAAYATEVFNGSTFQASGIHTQLRAQIVKQVYVNLLHRRLRAIYYPASEQGKSSVVSAAVTLQPWDNFQTEGNFTYADFVSDATDEMLYHYAITRLKLTYQVNRYLFFRGIGQYNAYRGQLATDFLASFTYIPGTVVYLGYGSLFQKLRWDGASFVDDDAFMEMQRGFFLKMSYLWRS